jgi:hypothetical protein
VKIEERKKCLRLKYLRSRRSYIVRFVILMTIPAVLQQMHGHEL